MNGPYVVFTPEELARILELTKLQATKIDGEIRRKIEYSQKVSDVFRKPFF